MSNLQPNCCLEFDFQKVDQHAGGKWLIHDTKRRKDNQLQSWNSPAEYPSWVIYIYIYMRNNMRHYWPKSSFHWRNTAKEKLAEIYVACV